MKLLYVLKKLLCVSLIFSSINSLTTQASGTADIIIFSYDRPMQLYAFLESLESHVSGIDQIFVITRTSTHEYAHAYAVVNQKFPQAQFMYQCAPYSDLKELTCTCISQSKTNYVLFGVDDIIVKDTIDLSQCAQALETHNAHGFFFRLGKNLDYCYPIACWQPLPPFQSVEADILRWHFNQGIYDWNYPNNLDFTLYRASDINALIKGMDYSTPNSLESAFMMHAHSSDKGLCYTESKIVNFPLNIVQNELPNAHSNSYSTQRLLELFNQGLKINIKAIEKFSNKSAHAGDASCITFIPRDITTEKPIVIVTPSYNNKDWWQWNLESLLNQNYNNYRIIITDDCSPDGTGKLIENYINTHKLHHKVTLIQNKERKGALYNLYTMIHSTVNESIIAVVDGDDALPDKDVLNRLNQIYSNAEIWLTYGQFIEHPTGIRGWCTPIPSDTIQSNSFREFPHLPSHMRTFKSWLFKKIKLEDLLDSNGMFYSMTCDYATMLPMIEMAGERHVCIQDIMYVYNNANSISDHRTSRQLQAHIAQVIRNKKRYTRLENAEEDFCNNCSTAKSDLIIFFEDNRIDLLDQTLSSIYRNIIEGLGQVFILSCDTLPMGHLDLLKTKYSDAIFLNVAHDRSNFRELLSGIYHFLSTNNYIIFAKNDAKIIAPISLSECVKCLEEYHAYAFLLHLSKDNLIMNSNHLNFLDLKKDLCAWNFALANGTWSCANNINMTLYRKTEKISQLFNYWLYSSADFVGTWANEGDLQKIGLCFKSPKICKM